MFQIKKLYLHRTTVGQPYFLDDVKDDSGKVIFSTTFIDEKQIGELKIDQIAFYINYTNDAYLSFETSHGGSVTSLLYPSTIVRSAEINFLVYDFDPDTYERLAGAKFKWVAEVYTDSGTQLITSFTTVQLDPSTIDNYTSARFVMKSQDVSKSIYMVKKNSFYFNNIEKDITQ